MTLRVMTLSIMTLSIMTLRITTLSRSCLVRSGQAEDLKACLFSAEPWPPGLSGPCWSRSWSSWPPSSSPWSIPVNGPDSSSTSLSAVSLCSTVSLSWHSRTMGCIWYGLAHRHLSIIDCLSFVMCPLLALLVIGFFFAAAINSTYEANKAGSTRH